MVKLLVTADRQAAFTIQKHHRMCSFDMAVTRPKIAAFVLMFCVHSSHWHSAWRTAAGMKAWQGMPGCEITLMMSLTASSSVISSLKSCFRIFWAPWLLAPMAVAFQPP